MKIRIKGNSIRIRISKLEVSQLADTGRVEEEALFIGSRLVYALQSTDEGNDLSATFHGNEITMYIPKTLIKDWPQNDLVGFSSNMTVGENDKLYLLLEKDFVCLDETTEDQSDNYENPHKTC